MMFFLHNLQPNVLHDNGTSWSKITTTIDKPKFPPSQTGGVWIDRQEILAGRTEMELNFTCAVDADPPAQVGWYDERGYQIRDPRDNIVLIDERPNNNVLRYRYRVDQTGSSGIMGGNMGSDGSWPPPGVNQYEKPARAQSVEQPNVQYECRAKNDLGSTSQMFKLRIGDLPPSPTLVSYTFEGNNLTLVLNQAASEPPVNHYKIELSDGVTVEFNSSEYWLSASLFQHTTGSASCHFISVFDLLFFSLMWPDLKNFLPHYSFWSDLKVYFLSSATAENFIRFHSLRFSSLTQKNRKRGLILHLHLVPSALEYFKWRSWIPFSL